MTAGWCARTIRSAVFAAVCVVLAALGHVLMSGATVPWWTLAAGGLVAGGAGWCLAGRERGLPLVVSLVVVTQGVLHSVFEFAQVTGAAGVDAGPPGPGGTGHPMGHDMSNMDMGSMPMGSMDVDPTAHLGHLAPMGHDMGGTSSLGMLAAHTLASLLCGLWLAHGERATFRVLRAVAGWLAAPLLLPLAVLPAPSRQPRIRSRRRRSDRVPRLLPLVDSITSRGPPAGIAVA